MPTYTTVDLSKANCTIPAGVDSVTLTAGGGQSGFGYNALADSGSGLRIVATVPVTSGQVITGVLGTKGADGSTSGTHAGGAPDGQPGKGYGGGGGGSSAISIDSVEVLRAPGGGGSSNTSATLGDGNKGGDGGYPAGADGSNAAGGTAGTGATASADGTGTVGTHGGGGGGGLHHGGSGTGGGAGGGGSAFVDPSLTVVSSAPGASAILATYKNPVTPFVPTIVSPSIGSWVAAGTVRLRWTYNADDTQAAADVEWRPSGGSTTPVSVTDATNYVDIILAPSADEWRVRTQSQDGLWGPWTDWALFNVETGIAAPTVTAPTADAVLTDITFPITANVISGQQAWQAQLIDVSSTVLWDTGQQTDSAAISTTGTAPVNNIAATVRVRARGPHVWTAWTTVAVTVAWTGPLAPVPSSTNDPDGGSIHLTWTQPAGGVDIDHYAIEAVEDGVRRTVAAWVDPADRAATDYIPRSGVQVAYDVIAFAASGAYTAGTVGVSD